MDDTKNKPTDVVEASEKLKKNKPLRKKRGRSLVIDNSTNEEMYRHFFVGVPLTDIAKTYNITVQQLWGIKEKNRWVTRKERARRKLEEKTDKELLNLSWQNAKDRAEFIEKIYKSFKLKHQRALDNLFRQLDDPNASTEFTDIREIKQLFEMLHRELNGGVDKTEQVLSGTLNVGEPIRIYTDEEKRAALKLLVGGKNAKTGSKT